MYVCLIQTQRTCLLNHVSTTATQYWQVHQRSRLTSFRVLSAAARILTGTHKFDRGLSWLLHLLYIHERVTYKLQVIMFGCQHGRAPQLSD